MSESVNTAKPAVPVGNEHDGPVTVPARAPRFGANILPLALITFVVLLPLDFLWWKLLGAL